MRRIPSGPVEPKGKLDDPETKPALINRANGGRIAVSRRQPLKVTQIRDLGVVVVASFKTLTDYSEQTDGTQSIACAKHSTSTCLFLWKPSMCFE